MVILPLEESEVACARSGVSGGGGRTRPDVFHQPAFPLGGARQLCSLDHILIIPREDIHGRRLPELLSQNGEDGSACGKRGRVFCGPLMAICLLL